MSGNEALSILQRPRFGDPAHIYAKRVLLLVNELKQLRKDWAHEAELEEIYDESPAPEVEELSEEQLTAEIGNWREAEAWAA